jgi:hypothetical protein
MNELTIILLAFALLLGALDWRKGLALCVLVGVAQDPLRKIAPGQPIYYVVLVGVMFGCTWLRAYSLRVPLGPNVLHGWRERLRSPSLVFAALVGAQALHSFFRYHSFTLTGIGLLVWLSPIPAVVLAHQFALRRGLAGIRAWMLFYVCVALASLLGVYLQYAGVNSRLLGELGEGLPIYDIGIILKAYSGFYRSSEIAAWHAATIACFIFTLSVGKRATVPRIAGSLMLIGILISLGLLTGRRKMLVEVIVFLSCYLFLVAWLQRGAARLAVTLLVLGVLGFVAVVAFVSPDLVVRRAGEKTTLTAERAQRMEGYVERGSSVFADIPARLSDVGVQPIVWAVQDYGILGAGLGTGSQGAHQILDELGMNHGASEGGLGKIALELGLPGLPAVAWLLVAIFRHILEQLRLLSRISPAHARVSYGLISLLVANLATFTIATQAYSDLFILLILGWSTGFVLAMPSLAARGEGARRHASQASAHPAFDPRLDPGTVTMVRGRAP